MTKNLEYHKCCECGERHPVNELELFYLYWVCPACVDKSSVECVAVANQLHIPGYHDNYYKMVAEKGVDIMDDFSERKTEKYPPIFQQLALDALITGFSVYRGTENGPRRVLKSKFLA